MILNKPNECFAPYGGSPGDDYPPDNGCSLAYLGRGFSRPGGTGSLGVAAIGESLGKEEVWDGLPFRPQARAGAKFEEICKLAGVDRKELLVWNIVACFVSHRTSVFTKNGYKELSKLVRGEQVLTHLGRFKPILNVIHNLPEVECRKIWFETGGPYLGTESHVYVTSDHRFMTESGWQYARDLKIGDYLLSLGEQCVLCGTWIVRKFNKWGNTLAFCSMSCKNKWCAVVGKDAMRLSMLEQYRTGKRDPYQITKAANDTVRQLIKTGWRPEQPDREQTRVKAALTRQALGFMRSKATWIGFGEKEVAAVLEAAGIEFVHQFALEGYNFDFKVGTVLLEIDGDGFRHGAKYKEQRYHKEELAELYGYSVVHFDNQDSPEAVLNVLDNDLHNYKFLPVKIINIGTRYKKGSWTLEVEGDSSYVAQGVVNHNCQPPDNRLMGTAYGRSAIDHCQIHFDRVVLGMRPNPACGKRVIIALGSVPLTTLIPNSGGVSDYRGFVLESKKYGLVVGGNHPSFIQRGNFELTPQAAMDLQRAVAVAKGEFTDYPAHPDFRGFEVNEFPSIDEAWSFYYKCRDNEKLLITFDIETPKTGWATEEERPDIEDAPIFQIQFSINTRSAIVFPWRQPYIDVAVALLKLKNAKANHFIWGFDIPKLKAAGVDEINGPTFCTMWMFKHWHPRLPRGLQNVAATVGFPFPWKFAFEDKPQWYGGCDVIAVQYILRWLPPRMKKMGIWQGYLEQIRDMYYILGPRPDASKESASDRGIPVNDEAREKLKVDLTVERRELNKELQKLVPDEIKGIEPRRNQGTKGEPIWDYGYQHEPKKLLATCQGAFEKWKSGMVGNGDVTDSSGKFTLDYYLANVLVLKTKPNKEGKSKEFRLKRGRFKGVDENGEEVELERWYKELIFKASSQQLIGYLNWKRRELENAK